jgi:hypothetical protein
VIIHPRRRGASSRRGQALIEFAIILPVLALLLVMAVDFGRVFFGWVALNNAVRIAADRAAQAPDAWPATNPINQQDQDHYRELTIRDMTAINCEPLPPPTGTDTNGIWDDEDVPDPAWTDFNGDGLGPGDHAVVTLTCNFRLITPLAEAIFGGPVTTSAQATFPIHEIRTTGLPDPPEPPCSAPVAAFSFAPDNAKSPAAVAFTDESVAGSSCPVTSWEWDFGDGSPLDSAQSPTHTYTCPGPANCTFTVSLTVTSIEGTDSIDDDVRVRK